MTAKSLPELAAECSALEKINAAVCGRIAALAHTEDQPLLCCVLCLMCSIESGDVCIRLLPASFERMVSLLRSTIDAGWDPGLARAGTDVPAGEAAAASAGTASAGESATSLLQALDRFERRLQSGFGALQKKLENCPVAGGERGNTPLVISRGRLYLRRYWQYEQAAAQYLASVCRAPAPGFSGTQRVIRALQLLFPDRPGPGEFHASGSRSGSGEPQAPCPGAGESGGRTVDLQKVAAAMAASGRFTVISGGPGTGKTTTVTKLLLLLLSVNPSRSRILLAAPTGKAAARIGESLAGQLKVLEKEQPRVLQELARLAGFQEPQQLLQLVPKNAGTVHALLKVRPHRASALFNAQKPLACDVLVIDEVSMVDLPLFAKICAALPPQCQVIMLGDKDQLCSVEAGSVLFDLCSSLSPEEPRALSSTREAQLAELCAYSGKELRRSGSLSDYVTVLNKSYRFKKSSGIGRAAALVNAFNEPVPERLEELKKPGGDFNLKLYRGHEDAAALQRAAAESILDAGAFGPFWNFLEAHNFRMDTENARKAMELLDNFRILCSNRHGTLGTSSLNSRIERLLRGRCPDGAGKWFPGQLLMVTANNPAVGVSNGDVGFYCPDREGEMRAWLRADTGSGGSGAGGVRDLSPVLLTSTESAWAITVHKSQGSEYKRVVLYLAERDNEILTKELVYTGITRARAQLELYADEKILEAALGRRVARESGLRERLDRPDPVLQQPE